MRKHQHVLQPALLLQPPEAEQGAEGLAGAGAGMHEHIVAAAVLLQQPHPQQLNQPFLPVARFDPGKGLGSVRPGVRAGGVGQAQIKGVCCHGRILLAPPA